MTIASMATDDLDAQHRLGLKAFLSAVPESIRKELRRKHFQSVREALEEARFLLRIEEEESSRNKVLAMGDKTPEKSSNDIVEECLKQLQSRGLLRDRRERQGKGKARCWCCGEEGHFMMQCPTVRKNKATQGGVAKSDSGNE